jgi:hypothetical protein
VSRPLRPFAVFGFASTHDALDAEAVLDERGIDVVTIPAPKPIGALCGIALRVAPDQAERALGYLQRAGITPSATIELEDY